MKRPDAVPQTDDNRLRLAARPGIYEMGLFGASVNAAKAWENAGAEKPWSGPKKIAAFFGAAVLAAIATVGVGDRDLGEPGRGVVDSDTLDELDAQHTREEAIRKYMEDDGEVDVLEEMDIEYEVENPDE